MLHFAVDAAFDDLLAAWRAHESVRAQNDVAVPALAASRRRLDRARRRMQHLRTAIHPEPSERESVVDVQWCESLETVVYLRWADRDRARPGSFRCACDGLVPIDWIRTGSDAG